jgi:hypothetical protein
MFIRAMASTTLPAPRTGDTEVVLDADARLRSGPPGFSATGGKLTQNDRVTIGQVSGDHVEVIGAGGTALGWTRRENLGAFFKDDAGLAACGLLPSTALVVDPAWPAAKKGMAALYNRLGGLLQVVAKATETTVPAALAVWSVESGGTHTANQALIRFENHVFFDRWGHRNAAAYDAHFQHGGRAGIIDKRWKSHKFRKAAGDGWRGFHGNQAAEYEALALARQLAGDDVAIQCVSIGGPQIVCGNFRKLGYSRPIEMYDAFQADERAHVLGFYDFCQYTPNHLEGRRMLLKFIADGRWSDFARRYNGSGQVQTYGAWLKGAFNTASQLGLS